DGSAPRRTGSPGRKDYPADSRSHLVAGSDPVMMGTAYKNKGVQELLDAIVAYLPSPLDRQVDATDLSKKANDAAKAAAAEGTKPEPVKVRLQAIPDAPLVCMAFKTVEEQFGQLTYVRLYQGKLSKG